MGSEDEALKEPLDSIGESTGFVAVEKPCVADVMGEPDEQAQIDGTSGVTVKSEDEALKEPLDSIGEPNGFVALEKPCADDVMGEPDKQAQVDNSVGPCVVAQTITDEKG